MESRFDHDFRQMRMHTDARATQYVKAVNSLVYTVEKDVVFGAREYA